MPIEATTDQKRIFRLMVDICQRATKETARIEVMGYYAPMPGSDQYSAWMKFVPPDDPVFGGVKHDPGIPLHALIPEKVLPVTDWVVRQIEKQRPEWFE